MISDTYAEMIANARRQGPCLGGHVWEGATYTTHRARVDFNDPDNRACGFVQERRCNRCAHRVTHVGAAHDAPGADLIVRARRLLATR